MSLTPDSTLANQERHFLVAQAVAEGIYDWDIGTNALWVSPRLIEIFGLTDEVSAADWNRRVHPEDFERYRAELRDCFKGLTARLDCEYRVLHSDGRYRWIEDRGVPVRDAAGRASRLVGALADITGRKEIDLALRETLDQQIAVSDVLKAINSSVFDLETVLQTVVATAIRLCRADTAIIYRNVGGEYRWAAGQAVGAEYEERERNLSIRPDRGTVVGRALLERRTIQIIDAWTDPLYEAKDDARIGGVHTLIGVPLLRDDAPIGAIGLARRRVEAFTEREIALVTTFADQAVVAIENARLITETREALEQQTATAEVLQVINSSPGDLAPVFDVILEKALKLCDAVNGHLYAYDGELLHPLAAQGQPRFVEWMSHRLPFRPAAVTPLGRLFGGEPIVHFANALTDSAFTAPELRELVDIGNIRTTLIVGLRKDDVLLGSITVFRQEVRSFTDKQIALLESFAAQAVIAMENARLITETREARDEAETALGNLKSAQANLIQAEKMASLGQLTAGIAHEIKNPLNFVNNFASLSVELLHELKETAAPALATLDSDKRADVDDTMELLTGNMEKIAEHGKRADNIVKSMLEHSRGASGERRAVDLNGLIEETLNLAYHGARAQDPSFNITLERKFAPPLAPLEVAPQELTRVFLNLFGNGFYAASKRARENGDGSFRPSLTVTTREDGDAVEVKVRDNGAGIPPEIKDKLFQPFFTTKPPGEGTGLGLSISYDIVTQQHGGTIAVDSRVGEFTEFTVRLPRH